MIAIEAGGLRKSFGAVQALDGLDLSVPQGSVCALLGPNGAGKTTAVRILATLTRPDAGTARVAGHDVVREPRRVRELIGLAAITLTVGAPVVMVVIFGYIFGSAISVPGGGNYRAYLVPGLFATIAANILPSMVAMARDSTRGVVDRFRSLPITRSAVPFGQAAATAVYGLASFVLMGLCGLAVGWRIHGGAGGAAGALALLLAFQFAASWVGIYLGLVIGKEETAAQASILVFPVTMLSNVFVPTGGMPAWLRAIADWNPISALAAAVRQLLGNPTAPANGAWPLEHPVTASLAWTALLLAVFVPLCATRYARPS